MLKTVDLSIIIVSYNTKTLTQKCLDAIYHSQFHDIVVETIVVDNGSIDDSYTYLRSTFPQSRVMTNKENLGFAKANNIGMKSAKGRYILLLNSDTEVGSETLSGMVAFMNNHPEYGASTCKLVLPTGDIDPACHRGFPTPWASVTYFMGFERVFPKQKIFSGYHAWYKPLTEVHDIDCPSGAFFLVRRETIELVGVLDEQFFMYGEDIDWAYRMHEKGLRIAFVPKYTTLHKKKQSGRSNQDTQLRNKTQMYFYQTMSQFYKKHYERLYPGLVNLAIMKLLEYKAAQYKQ